MKPLQLLLLGAIALSLFAQNKEQIATGFNNIQADKLRADLTFLSSDAMEGRMSLERGDDAAIQWIASEFAKAGLKPGVGNSYLQPVPLVDYKMDRERTSLTIRQNGASVEFRNPDFTGNFPNDGNYKGPIVFAGFGITAPELKYDDYSGIDAKGKIVLI